MPGGLHARLCHAFLVLFCFTRENGFQERSYHSSHLISYDFILSGRSHCVRYEETQSAMAATNHRALSSDKTRKCMAKPSV